MTNHAHPMVAKSDVSSLNERYAPWRIEKSYVPSIAPTQAHERGHFQTQARNTETGEVIYRCEGWSQGARGQALNAILERRAADESSAPYRVERLDTHSEDGHLWFVVDPAGEMVSGSGWINREDVEEEARDLNALAKLTDGQRAAVAELRSHCPAPGDYGAAWLQGDKVNEYRYLDPVSRDAYDGDHVAEFVATFVADITGESDSVIVTVDGNVLTPEDRSHLIVTPEAIAAAGHKIAREAAESFTFDDEREDAESAAQRAADILRDLSADDVPAFLTRVFGLPAEERHAEKEMRARSPHGVPERNDSWTIEAWRLLREQARTERGFPDVARVLVFEFRDILVPLAFNGHEATEDRGESTNLSAWREALHALETIAAVRAHTFGGCCLADFGNQLDLMDSVAIGALIESVQWASYNATTWQDGRDSFEVGMPRAE